MNEFRISARTSRTLLDEGFHVGRLLSEIAKHVEGEGGGHDGAGGMQGMGDAEHVLNLCMKAASKDIERIIKAKKQQPSDK